MSASSGTRSIRCSAKSDEEITELREAIASADQDRITDELGDWLFTVVNIARWCKVEPEDALRRMVDRFAARFQQMEEGADKPLRSLTPQEWDDLWNKAKTTAP